MNLKKFVRERDKALLSLDEKKIRAYGKKYGVPMPDNPEVFWRGVHKAICYLNSATVEQKNRSALWLLEHGSTTEIGGKNETD